MYAYYPTDAGKGIKAACLAWVRTFKNSLYFRKLFCLVFFTVMILFRTLLNRNMWMNPLSDVMGGWWIWEKQSDGTVTLTVDAVCDMVICDDAVITHELTVKFADDGSFQYLGNEKIQTYISLSIRLCLVH